MSDGIGALFGELADEQDEPPGRGRGRGPVRRRRRRWLRWALVVVLLVVAVGAYFGIRQVLGLGYYPDYSGTGQGDLVVEIDSGTITDIGNRLQQDGVVASSRAFVKASKSDSRVGGVQPGYYVLRHRMSAAAAVNLLVAPSSRVGELEVRSGWQLDDTTAPNGTVSKGILSRIADASCVTLDGHRSCLTVADLQSAIQNTPPTQLGVPAWAVPAVGALDPAHRLEGLIMPGVYNFRPGTTAVATLHALLTQSATQLQVAGLPSANQQSSGFSPYQVLVIASIVEREAGVQADMPKIARVLYNRLATGMDLELDSTVDYALNRPMVRTTPADRPGAGAYNTYANSGLPPSPISSPSVAAIEAAESPAAGDWLYFVVCQKNGASCFATTYQQHQTNVALAQANGAY